MGNINNRSKINYKVYTIPKDLVIIIAKHAIKRDPSLLFPFWYSCKKLHNDPYLRKLGNEAKLENIKKLLQTTISRYIELYYFSGESISFTKKCRWRYNSHIKNILIAGYPDTDPLTYTRDKWPYDDGKWKKERFNIEKVNIEKVNAEDILVLKEWTQTWIDPGTL